MKHDGPYTTGDCVRSIKAIASAEGRVIYIAPDEGQKKRPRRSRTPARSEQEQNVLCKYNREKEDRQCRK